MLLQACHGGAHPVQRANDAQEVKAVEVERDTVGGDLDAVLADDAGDVAGEVVRAGLGDLEEAVGVAGRVGRVDGDARLDFGEGLERRRDWPAGGSSGPASSGWVSAPMRARAARCRRRGEPARPARKLGNA
jgi:hypothetical protein